MDSASPGSKKGLETFVDAELMPVILTTQKVETGRSQPKTNPGKKCETLSEK
jgi:hypothetical protein